MTYTFKLSKRLAVLHGVIAGAAVVGACASDHLPTQPVEPDTLPPAPPPVASVVISPAADSSFVGCLLRFTATPLDSTGSALEGRAVSWATSDSAVVVVDSAGVASLMGPGAAAVIASAEGHEARADLSALPRPERVGHYASPFGSEAGDGSPCGPFSLATALAGAGGRVQPGDTIWLLGGTYRGPFRSLVGGVAGRPVVVRQYPGERAIIDGAGTSSSVSVFYVGGAYAEYWDFELTNSDPVRTTGSTANNVRPNVVSNYADHTKFINLVIHDGGVAFYNATGAEDVEIAGCIIYNNGWQGPDRGHGHALYIKSSTGPVVARDNVLFNQFGYGVHVYTDAGSGQLNNVRLLGNVAFNNGTLADNSNAANILVGGDDYASGDDILGNFTYFPPGVGGTNVAVGWDYQLNGDVTVRGNYLVGGDTVLNVGWWARATVSDNVLAGEAQVVSLDDTTLLDYAWTGSQYHRDPLSPSWSFAGVGLPMASWQVATGLGEGDVASSGWPAQSWVFVRPNPYQSGRAIVVVYNWAREGTAQVDLAGVLSAGEGYQVRNVQDLFGAPVAVGTYDGAPVALPLVGVEPPIPVGLASSPAPRTGPDFEVFLVTRSQ
jgi:hypothetical protein